MKKCIRGSTTYVYCDTYCFSLFLCFNLKNVYNDEVKYLPLNRAQCLESCAKCGKRGSICLPCYMPTTAYSYSFLLITICFNFNIIKTEIKNDVKILNDL